MMSVDYYFYTCPSYIFSFNGRNTFNYANAYLKVQYLDLGYWGSIQKEVIYNLKGENQFFVKRDMGVYIYDRSLERDL
jgi:hypothetical protein